MGAARAWTNGRAVIALAAAVISGGLGWIGKAQTARPVPVPVSPAGRNPAIIAVPLIRPGRVIGTIYTNANAGDVTPSANARRAIELPDITVSLRSAAGATVATTQTRLDGSFDLRPPRTGTYNTCWTVDGNSGCGQALVVGRSTVWAGRIGVRGRSLPLTGVILTGDRRPCWMSDSFFGLDVSTRVVATPDATGTATPAVRANTEGEYAVFGLKPGRHSIAASCEKAERMTHTVVGTSAAPLDLMLPNRAPRLTGMFAGDQNGRSTLRADPGAVIALRTDAIDPENDPVEYRWRAAALDGTLSGGTGREQKWSLPAGPGMRSSYVMARDGRGGFAYQRVLLRAGAAVVDFSGVVIDEASRAPIANADVTVAGKSVVTDSRGWFTLQAAPLADDRYVLNITRSGFARLSRVHDKSATGATYEMIRAQVDTLPASQVLTIDDKTGNGFCGEGREGRPPPLLRRAGLAVMPTDFVRRGDGPRPDPRADARLLADAKAFTAETCRRRGIQIAVPANGFVQQDGSAVVGAITASSATLNPARRAIPGDYQAVTAGGQRAELLSFGAAYAEFRDAAGKLLKLRPGVAAEVRIPVPPSQVADAKPAIALWSYDDKQGRWIEEGQAQLQATAAGPAYVGKTTHFSEINMDVAGTDPAFATCVRFEIAPGAFSGWSDKTLRAYVSYGGNSVQVKETDLDGKQYHAIYRIPFGTGTPNSLRVEVRGTFAGQRVLLIDNIINTDARDKMTGTDLWPPYPYEPCGTPIVLSEAPGVVPPYAEQDASGRPFFLIGPGGTQFNPADGDAAATAYYAAVDPGNAKTTLGDWWGLNNFGPAGEGTNASFTRAPYMNHNDLGFGRDMNCQKTGNNVACYVTNYGLPDQNPQNADDAESRNPDTRAATVVMEYNPAAANNENVQFYVYNGGVATSTRIKFADLDGFGPKPVPYLCLVCHGGTVNAANKAEFSRFREFDMPSFRYSGNRQWAHSGANNNSLNNTELTAFTRLNQMVRGTTAGLPIGRLIDAWYTTGFAGAKKPVLPAPPPGWGGSPAGYHEVYGTACRACHLARDEGNGDAAYFVFAQQSNFASTSYIACGANRKMPNAVVTYKNFWASTSRVSQYEVLTGVANGTCKN